MIHTTGFQLADWQTTACEQWLKGSDGRPYRGTLEIFTGGGKTLIALEALARSSIVIDDLKCAIVVPTEALARQWRDCLQRYTSLTDRQIGMMGAGSDDTFSNHSVIVAVINSAAKKLPSLVADSDRMMLIVDECHRAGAKTFSQVLNTPARFRMGLSATPDREELDEDGEQIAYNDQIAGQKLGDIVFRFTLREAREAGWLPDYEIHHHGIRLSAAERSEYEDASRRIDDLADRLQELGVETGRARTAALRGGEVGKIAGAYVAATAKRKDLLYRASERGRVAARIINREFRIQDDRRVLVFHERVDAAEDLFRHLQENIAPDKIELEHSRLAQSAREKAMIRFRSGDAQVLVSVKSLVEGIDVPDADVGLSVAASSSVRQRIQSLGRVLRRRFDSERPDKHAVMHLIYVSDTVDESIYGKENWSDLTGSGRNCYWLWPLNPDEQPERVDSPPRTPLPSEEEEWVRLGCQVPTEPQPWNGLVPPFEYSVDTRGNVSTTTGALITNGQSVDKMVSLVRRRPGGRFYVTPIYRLVVVRGDGKDGGLMVVGKVSEPFIVRESTDEGEDLNFELGDLRPGQPYFGPNDKSNGTFKISQKQGGVIQRKLKGGVTEFALTSSPADPVKSESAKRVLTNWKSLAETGMTFHINRMWHAWYAESGEIRFLGDSPNGFAWISDFDQENA